MKLTTVVVCIMMSISAGLTMGSGVGILAILATTLVGEICLAIKGKD